MTFRDCRSNTWLVFTLAQALVFTKVLYVLLIHNHIIADVILLHKNRLRQNINHAKTLTTPKHRPRQNINSAKTLTTPKHQLFQNIDHAEVDWPKSPGSLLIKCLTVIIDNLVPPGKGAFTYYIIIEEEGLLQMLMTIYF